MPETILKGGQIDYDKLRTEITADQVLDLNLKPASTHGNQWPEPCPVQRSISIPQSAIRGERIRRSEKSLIGSPRAAPTRTELSGPCRQEKRLKWRR